MSAAASRSSCGTPNYLDDDLDGDGVANENDTAVATTHEMTGTTGAQSTITLGFYAGNGMILHAPYEGTVVRTQPIWTSDYYIVRIGI